MSDIEKYTNTQVDTVSQAPMSQGTLAMLNLEQQAAAMQNALTIAQAMCATQMVPKAFFRKPEDGAAAIMYGAELGLNAMQSLQWAAAIEACESIEDLNEVMGKAQPQVDQTTWDDLCARANAKSDELMQGDEQ